jgi:RNA polymerase sigma-70 factor (ECF subfamily)
MTPKAVVAERLREHIAGLRRYALVLTRNAADAEDLVQECLVKAIAAADTWDETADMRKWLFRILHNTHVSELRKQKVRREAQIDLPEPVVEADQVKRIELRQVLDALDELPEAQRRPILLIALEGMSYADAAETLGVPLGTLYSRLGRGREALRKMMDTPRSKLRLVI